MWSFKKKTPEQIEYKQTLSFMRQQYLNLYNVALRVEDLETFDTLYNEIEEMPLKGEYTGFSEFVDHQCALSDKRKVLLAKQWMSRGFKDYA